MSNKKKQIKEKIDKIFYSVPQPSKLKEKYEGTWKDILNGDL